MHVLKPAARPLATRDFVDKYVHAKHFVQYGSSLLLLPQLLYK